MVADPVEKMRGSWMVGKLEMPLRMAALVLQAQSCDP